MAEKVAAINRVTAREGEITILSNHKSNSILNSASLTERKHIMAKGTLDTRVVIKVVRIKKVQSNNHLKAFVDISINDAFTVKGLKVVEGDNGLFVGMPSILNKDNGRWYESVRCTNEEVQDDLSNTVLAAYKKE